MQKHLIYLILIMFVGVHVISDLTPHFHAVATQIEIADNNIDDQSTNNSIDRILASTQITSRLSGNDCCSKIKILRADIDLHCIADCGLASTEFAAYHPNPRLYLAPPNDSAANSSSINDLFRPPIV